MEKLIETNNLRTEFHTFEGVVKALNGVSVVVKRGESYGLVGESGCGKSVTVRSMMRIVQSPGKIADGDILLFFNEKHKHKAIDITEQSELYMETIRGNDISMIFQEASTSLNPVYTIGFQVGESFVFHRLSQMLEETIEELKKELGKGPNAFAKLWKNFQLKLFKVELKAHKEYEESITEIDHELYHLSDQEGSHHRKKESDLHSKREKLNKKHILLSIAKRVPFLNLYRKKLDKTIRSHVLELLQALGIPNPHNIIDRYPHELSGGMQQRIVIATALACYPRILIADEPTSNLDVTIQAQIVDLIKKLKNETISSVLFITHDLGIIAEVCDRVSVMYAGDVCETAAVGRLFENPLHPYSKGLLNSVPKVEQKGKLETIPGSVPNLISPPSGCRFHPRCTEVMDRCKKEKPETIEYEKDHYVACFLYPTPSTKEA